MRAILVIGWESATSPKPLYCGLDGVEANKVAADAQETGKYIRIGKLVNPSITPMPHVPVNTPAQPAKEPAKQPDKAAAEATPAQEQPAANTATQADQPLQEQPAQEADEQPDSSGSSQPPKRKKK